MTDRDYDDLRQAVLPAFVADISRRAHVLEERLDAVQRERDPARRAQLVAELAFEAHALKGAARTLGLGQVEALADGLDLLVSRVRGGETTVDSELIESARLTVLSIEPLAREHLDQPVPAPQARPTTVTVLSVEDNEPNRRLIEHALARRPHVRLVTATRGWAALELARAERPDLILLDLFLPDVAGDKVLRRLREDPATRDIPVVVLSADATPASIERVLAAGASDYFTKPIDLARLLRLVDEL